MSIADTYAGKVTAAGDGNDAFRLGMVDGTGTTSIGSAQITLHAAGTMLDTTVVPYGAVQAPVGTSTWTAYAGGLWKPGVAIGWTKLSTDTVPQAVSKIDGSMTFSLKVNQSYLNAATSIISMKSGVTMTLQYL
jgi:hypothetical protein